jgi:hypothetical protein
VSTEVENEAFFSRSKLAPAPKIAYLGTAVSLRPVTGTAVALLAPYMVSLPIARPRLQGLASRNIPANLTRAHWMLGISAVLGLFSLGALLCSGHYADGDLWAKLALGAHVWKYGNLPRHDVFAFTEVLPEYVDHEWGAGTIFFGLLKFFGPSSLMWLKIVLALGAISAAFNVGRRAGCDWSPLLLLAIPSAACVAIGFGPVIRSHTFTYFFFAVSLVCLEAIVTPLYRTRMSDFDEEPGISKTWRVARSRAGTSIPALALICIMLLWVNIHGGFVAGLGTIAIYCCVAASQEFLTQHRLVCGDKRSGPGGEVTKSKMPIYRTLLLVALGCLLVSCINPYGAAFWRYLLPAVLAKRPLIVEWQPLPIFARDSFTPFRVLFLLVAFLVTLGWARVTKKSWTGLTMLVVTAFLAWRSRRHAPFFGVASLAFAGPYLAGTMCRTKEFLVRGALSSQSTTRLEMGRASQEKAPLLQSLLCYGNSAIVLLVICGATAMYAANNWLPDASFQVLAPVGDNPVREADILSLAQVQGNLATPFHWGSYSAWRLYPNIKISIDGRYEAAFPESTFLINTVFYAKAGPSWDLLTRKYPVDFVILDLSRPGLRPEDLVPHGYSLIYVTRGSSALMALEKHAAHLRQIASGLPPTTIDPLDPAITARW